MRNINKINLDVLKQKQLWAVIVPIILVILTIHAGIKMSQAGNNARLSVKSLRDIEKDVAIILDNKKANGDKANGVTAFNGISSAIECAGSIQENNITRGERAKPQRQKDGSFLNRETYKLDNVRFMQVVQFLDAAERKFRDVTCTQVTFTASGSGNTSDVWVANVTLEYQTREAPAN